MITRQKIGKSKVQQMALEFNLCEIDTIVVTNSLIPEVIILKYIQKDINTPEGRR